jgi:hypothetical protein
MSVRDLLTFNLFLQVYEWLSLISGFCAWSDRSQSRRARRNRKPGNGLGTNLQQSFGVPTAAPDICAQPQPTLGGEMPVCYCPSTLAAS